jgi:hypothetical protein
LCRHRRRPRRRQELTRAKRATCSFISRLANLPRGRELTFCAASRAARPPPASYFSPARLHPSLHAPCTGINRQASPPARFTSCTYCCYWSRDRRRRGHVNVAAAAQERRRAGGDGAVGGLAAPADVLLASAAAAAAVRDRVVAGRAAQLGLQHGGGAGRRYGYGRARVGRHARRPRGRGLPRGPRRRPRLRAVGARRLLPARRRHAVGLVRHPRGRRARRPPPAARAPPPQLLAALPAPLRGRGRTRAGPRRRAPRRARARPARRRAGEDGCDSAAGRGHCAGAAGLVPRRDGHPRVRGRVGRRRGALVVVGRQRHVTVRTRGGTGAQQEVWMDERRIGGESETTTSRGKPMEKCPSASSVDLVLIAASVKAGCLPCTCRIFVAFAILELVLKVPRVQIKVSAATCPRLNTTRFIWLGGVCLERIKISL